MPDARRFTFVVWAAMFVAALVFVLSCGTHCPHGDEWDTLPAALGTEPFWQFVTGRHNEHLYAPGRLVWALSVRLTGGLTAGRVISVLLLAVTAWGFVWLARAARGGPGWCDALVPVLLLHWGHAENLLMSYQVVFCVLAVVAVGLTGAVASARQGGEASAAWRAGWALCLAAACGGMGLTLVPSVALWCGWLAWRAGRRGLLAVLPAALAVGYLTLCVATLPPRDPALPKPTAAGAAWAALEVFAAGAGVGPAQAAGVAPVGGAVVLLVLAALLRLAWKARDPAERPRALGLVAVLAGFVLTALAVGSARGTGLASRYGLASALAACVALVALADVRGRRWSGRGVVAAAGVALALMNFNWGRDYGRHWRHCGRRVLVAVAAGEDARVAGELGPSVYYPNTEALALRVAQLRALGYWG